MMKSAVFLLLLAATAANAQKCTLCMDGAFPNFPDNKLKADNIQNGIETCGDLAAAIVVVDEDSDNCRSGRAIATFCGCSVPADACKMCGGDIRIPADAVDIQLNYNATDFIVGAPEGTSMGCEAMESYLHTQKGDDPRCAEIAVEVADTCMCSEGTAAGGGGGETPDDIDVNADGSSAVVVKSALSGVVMLVVAVMMA